MLMHESPISPYGGMGLVVAEVCKRLSDEFDITVFGYDVEMKQHGEFNHDGYKVVLAMSTNNMFNYHPSLGPLITEDVMTDNIFMYLKDTKFDMIHICDSFLHKTAKHIKIRDRCPQITTVHLSTTLATGIENIMRSPVGYYNITQEAHNFMASSYVTTVSETCKEQLLNFFPESIFTRGITVIPNGIDLKKYFPHKTMAAKDICKTDKPIIGFVGRCSMTKGIPWLCAAIRMNPQFHFLCISSKAQYDASNCRKEMEATVQECRNITWLDSVRVYDDSKIDLMAGCDYAVMPSSHEPWGVVANEWQALGIPLITTSAVNSVKPGTAVIANSIESFLDKVKHIDKLDFPVDAALEYVKTLSWDSVANQYREVYRQCLKKSID